LEIFSWQFQHTIEEEDMTLVPGPEANIYKNLNVKEGDKVCEIAHDSPFDVPFSRLSNAIDRRSLSFSYQELFKKYSRLFYCEMDISLTMEIAETLVNTHLALFDCFDTKSANSAVMSKNIPLVYLVILFFFIVM
jgi:hypothetical protein